jgi:hypothetical protein
VAVKILCEELSKLPLGRTTSKQLGDLGAKSRRILVLGPGEGLDRCPRVALELEILSMQVPLH